MLPTLWGRCVETPGRFFHRLRAEPLPRGSKDGKQVRCTPAFPMEVSGEETVVRVFPFLTHPSTPLVYPVSYIPAVTHITGSSGSRHKRERERTCTIVAFKNVIHGDRTPSHRAHPEAVGDLSRGPAKRSHANWFRWAVVIVVAVGLGAGGVL